MTLTKFYKKWRNLKARCQDKKWKDYKNYGGRGIKTCDRWLIFVNFYEDMYDSYLKHVEEFGEKNTTLDRRDNDKGYTKENCRWATYKEQNNNRRNVLYVTYNGETKLLKDWAIKLNINYITLYWRLYKLNWSIEKTFNILYE